MQYKYHYQDKKQWFETKLTCGLVRYSLNVEVFKVYTNIVQPYLLVMLPQTIQQ